MKLRKKYIKKVQSDQFRKSKEVGNSKEVAKWKEQESEMAGLRISIWGDTYGRVIKFVYKAL